jgi:hypothetical protein
MDSMQSSVYLRVSSDRQKSFIDQTRAIIEYAKKKGIKVTNKRVFSEKVSGGDYSKQVALHQCIKSLNDDVKHLIVYSVSRLGRSTTLHATVRALLDDNVIIHSVSEPHVLHDSRLLHSHINESIIELVELKRKINESNLRAIKNGFFTRGNVPVGFCLNTVSGANSHLVKKYLTLGANFKKINRITHYTDRRVIREHLSDIDITPKQFAHFKKNKKRCLILVKNSVCANHNAQNPTELDVISTMFTDLHV